MAWIMDTYSMRSGHTQTAVVTGKPIDLGGSRGRSEATGRGCMVVTEQALKRFGLERGNARVVIQGFGNVGGMAAKLMERAGFKVIAIVEYDGAVYNDKGLDIRALAAHRQKTGSVVDFDGGENLGREEAFFLETDVLMPAPITLAHRLVKRQAQVRKSGKLEWLRPDAKSQVTLRYEDNKPVGLEAVVLSTQHSPEVSTKALREAVMEEILKPVLPAKWVDKRTKYHINPTGRFVTGGPVGDCGLTGRKIIVDTYGGYARHGGGAFSGKDPSKVDRSAAYAARYVAKNLVAAGLAQRVEVQVSYAIGVAEPTSIMVETFGTSHLSRERLTQLVRKHFDLTPYGLREMLDLVRPIYQKTAAYGHFGRTEPEFTWERTDLAETLAAEGKGIRAA